MLGLLPRLFAALRGRQRSRRRPRPALPPWAETRRRRRAHIRRVADLVEWWAEEMGVAARERNRWLTAVWLHDALRDADLPNGVSHGAAAAQRAAQDGESDPGVLDAVRYHSVGYTGWDDVGKMLYLADYLEPGRKGRRRARGRLAKQVPDDRDGVLQQVLAQQIEDNLRAGRPINPLTLEFWNSLNTR